MKSTNRSSLARSHSRGIVLVVALVLLLVVSIGSTVAVKLALNSSSIAIGLRGANEAQQSADLALRWCELQLRQTVAGVAAANADNFNLIPKGSMAEDAWSDFQSFDNNSRPIPQVILAAAGMAAPPRAPRCMIQELDAWSGRPEDDKDKTGANSSTPEYRNYRITARGLSRDYNDNTAGETRGAEVWLQSNLAVTSK